MWDVEEVCSEALVVGRARVQEIGSMGWLSWPAAAPEHTQDRVQELHPAWGKWPCSLLVRCLRLS